MSDSWSLLESLVHKGIVQYVDYALAQYLTSFMSEPSQNVAVFICYLSAAARSGHVCVKITEDDVDPAMNTIFTLLHNESCTTSLDFNQREYRDLQQAVLLGARNCPSEILTVVNNIPASDSLPLCRQKDRFYLQRNFVAETSILEYIMGLYESLPSITLDCDLLNLELQRCIAEQKLLGTQARAILHSAQHSLTFITGGPGTGKTYTAGFLIQLLLKNIKKSDVSQFEVMLSAPTGKATAQLQQSLYSVIKEERCKLQCGTLQRLLSRLKWRYFSADFIIIDESSMIDISLFSRLLQAIKPGARLILLGDAYQLPPVEVGNLFADLLHWGSNLTPSPVISLSTCLRIESEPILEFADAVKIGQIEDVLDLLKNSTQGLHRLTFPSEEPRNLFALQQFLVRYALNFFPTLATVTDPFCLLQEYQKFRMLTPLRHGPLGVEALNAQTIKEIQLKVFVGQLMALPILITQNDEGLELYNGDVGILLCKKQVGYDVEKYHGDAFFFTRHNQQKFLYEDTRLRCIASILLPAYELAYCLSIHKSQGSEFDHVLLILSEGAELFGRQILYTGITRARKKLDLFAYDHTLQQTVEQKNMRLSGFSERMCHLV